MMWPGFRRRSRKGVFLMSLRSRMDRKAVFRRRLLLLVLVYAVGFLLGVLSGEGAWFLC